jgi:7-cyano-7-deazaguanine synthase
MSLEDNSRALVVFSGGQDSTTCLFWALSKFQEVKIITFDYEQKHKIEIESAQKIAQLARLEFDLIKIPRVLRSSSPLVDPSQRLDLKASVEEIEPGVQNTFVPGRNILFLTIAGNVALEKDCTHVVMGVCQEDFGGYYDCRQDFITAMQTALNQGLFGRDTGLTIHTPLMNLSKAGAVKLALDLPKPWNELVMQALELSHTCYAGQRPPCQQCNACLLRARGFQEAGVIDPLVRV